jgi:hypothetical protein
MSWGSAGFQFDVSDFSFGISAEKKEAAEELDLTTFLMSQVTVAEQEPTEVNMRKGKQTKEKEKEEQSLVVVHPFELEGGPKKDQDQADNTARLFFNRKVMYSDAKKQIEAEFPPNFFEQTHITRLIVRCTEFFVLTLQS